MEANGGSYVFGIVSVNVARQRGSTNWRFEMLWPLQLRFSFHIFHLRPLVPDGQSQKSWLPVWVINKTASWFLQIVLHATQLWWSSWHCLLTRNSKMHWQRNMNKSIQGDWGKHLQRGWRCWGWIFDTFLKTNIDIDIAPANRPSQFSKGN